MESLAELDSAVAQAYEASLVLFEQLGAKLEPFEFGKSFDSCVEHNGIIIAYEGWHNHKEFIEQQASYLRQAIVNRARFTGPKILRGGLSRHIGCYGVQLFASFKDILNDQAPCRLLGLSATI